MTEAAMLTIDSLCVGTSHVDIINSVSMNFPANSIRAIVGASGSGKSMLAKCVNGLLPDGVVSKSGHILYEGRDLLGLPEDERRKLRGKKIGLIFQDALSALNPVYTIGEQLREAQRFHFGFTAEQADVASIEMLAGLEFPAPEKTLMQYPHELSGGLRQRAMIASQLLLKPDIVFADEPTTALDSLVQHKTLSLLVAAARRTGTALVLISHDLGVVYRYAKYVYVMRCGAVVEHGLCENVLGQPSHPYTRELLEASPSLTERISTPPLQASQPLLRIEGMKLSYCDPILFPWQKPRSHRALSGISFALYAGQLTAIIGASGSGKSSAARALLGLVGGAEGTLEYDGIRASLREGTTIKYVRKVATMVFQDSFSSLDPRFTVAKAIKEGLPVNALSASELNDRVREMLSMCELPQSYAKLYPHQLSGGERQRVAIARALISNPQCLIADEPVSALDLAVQKSILALFNRLKTKLNIAILLITHDMSVVRSTADDILVLNNGRVVESGTPDDIFENPQHPYTHELLKAAPRLEKRDGVYSLSSFEQATEDKDLTFYWLESSDPYALENPGYVLKSISKSHKVAIHSRPI